MFRLSLILFYVALATCFLHSGEPGANGKRFDTGLAMTAKAKNAPEALDQAKFLLGQYDVTWTIHQPEDQARTTKAKARIDYMNRGWLYSLTLSAADFDGKGNAVEMLGFLTYQPSSKVWGLGVANTYSERIHMASGAFHDAKLVLQDVQRRNGGLALSYERQTIAPSEKGFTWIIETSKDGTNWQKSETRSFQKREAKADFLAGEGYGKPSAERPKAAAGFDFLIGEWQANHDMTFPNGQRAKWPANATAVHVLGGKGILEYNWFDTDPNLPDAATSIIRLYNRAERRWESLYTSNRGNGLLHFGGNQEGDKIVLHAFNTDRQGTVSHWVFHSMKKDTYQWYGESSKDGGQSYTKTWLIDFKRKP